jgi:hypothetical protein
MLCKGSENKYEQLYSGPHSILQVNTNGTVCLQLGAVANVLNICWLDPYKAAPNSIRGGECNMRQSRRNRRANNTKYRISASKQDSTLESQSESYKVSQELIH